MTNRKTRYRFYSPKGQLPFLTESQGNDQDKQINTPNKQDADTPGTDGDDLKNVDKSQGGYGGGSGFSPDRT